MTTVLLLLLVWFAIGTVVALALGPVLKRRSADLATSFDRPDLEEAL